MQLLEIFLRHDRVILDIVVVLTCICLQNGNPTYSDQSVEGEHQLISTLEPPLRQYIILKY